MRSIKHATSGISRLASLITLLVLVAVLGILAGNHQAVIDWLRLRNYEAPATIASIATQDTMTASARRIFYVNHPIVADKTNFRTKCPNNGGEQSIVLGCYHGNQQGIYVLGVSDSRLEGVEQVTAAHEMLHAAYDRLSRSDKDKVNAMLTDYYDHDLTDQRIKKTIDAYRQSEPNDLVNEMHSIFGTEIASLPPGLEDYYKRYFTNRQAIATFAGTYQQEFTTRQTIVDNDDAQLSQLKQNITDLQADLKTKLAAIQSQKQTLESERDTNPRAFNSGVPTYNSLIDSYNTQVKQLQALVSQYNQLVTTRNALAGELDQLTGDLDANAQTIQN